MSVAIRTATRIQDQDDFGSVPGAGSNDGVSAAEVGAVVFDTANALVGVLGAGHATNMANLL